MDHLKTIKRRYMFVRSVEILMLSVAVALLIYFSTKLVTSSNIVAGFVAAAVGLIVAYLLSQRLNLFDLNERRLALYLNRKYPRLQESADLLLKSEDELSPLQQLQKKSTLQRIEEIYPTIKLPHKAGRASIALVLSIVTSIMLTSFLEPLFTSNPKTNHDNHHQPVDKQLLPPAIVAATIQVLPPAYTQTAGYTSPNLNAQFPEGSIVKWNLTFKGSVSKPTIILSAKDTIPLIASQSDYSVRRTFTESGFYQLAWQNADGTIHYSDYHRLVVVKDNPPSIQIQRPVQHLELNVTDSRSIDLSATITDDYGLTASSIVATVSKGSGEAVKFREVNLTFDTPDQIAGKEVQASRKMDLTSMGLQTGDELYFYIEASDNKTPYANKTRTETYFVTLRDTSAMTNSLETSLGVDLMPEYFRSQRQIIIDSEKLMREKKRILKQRFNERSNELGYDQKVLRLRYGEFLGEEFESSIGPTATETDESHDDEDPRKTFGHEHDGANEHNLIEEKKSDRTAHSHHQESLPSEKRNTLEDFVHAHDDDEEATFFVQSIKAKLKAAVALMWDAELYLRLYQPEKSLPYQYRALKLLKEISQDSRIYVHRTGFDPPPLKEDKRLTGDLSEISSSTSNVQMAEKKTVYPAINDAIDAIEKLIDGDTITITNDIKRVLKNAGHSLATLEQKQPGHYLHTLSRLNNVIQDKPNESQRRDVLMKIRSALWKALPRESQTPAAKSGVVHELDHEFLENLAQ